MSRERRVALPPLGCGPARAPVDSADMTTPRRGNAASGGQRPVDAPALRSQRKRKLVRVDCRFPGTNVVVELLGYQWHRTPMQLHEDAERVNRLQLDGFVVMQFTYTHVVTRSLVMRENLTEALRPPAAA